MLAQATVPNEGNTPMSSDDHEKRNDQTIRVAVVDDHSLFRAGVIASLSQAQDITIVGQAADVPSSIAMISEVKPDVVLLDVHMPGGQGGGGAEIILQSVPLAPKTLYLALSVSDAPADVGAVIRAGARGYVTKTIAADDLIASIRQVAEGYAVFSPRLAGFVLNAFQGAPQSATQNNAYAAASTGTATNATATAVTSAPATGVNATGVSATGATVSNAAAHDIDDADDIDVGIDALSPREQDVMRFIARGYTYKEVASELFISVKTVETHVSKVLRKLQLSNRGELTRWATLRHIV